MYIYPTAHQSITIHKCMQSFYTHTTATGHHGNGIPPSHTVSHKPNLAAPAYLTLCCTNSHCHPFLLRVERVFFLFSVLLTQSQHSCLKQRTMERFNFNISLHILAHTPTPTFPARASSAPSTGWPRMAPSPFTWALLQTHPTCTRGAGGRGDTTTEFCHTQCSC